MDCTATSTSHINLGTGLYLPALYQMYYLPVNLVVFRGTQVLESWLSLRCQVRHRSQQPLTHGEDPAGPLRLGSHGVK